MRASGVAQRRYWDEFGLILAVTFLTSAAYNAIVYQISNILPEVYGFSQTQTASVVSTAGLVGIVFFFLAGSVLRRSGAELTTGRSRSPARPAR